MNVPSQICSFIDVVCELVADYCFFHCLVYCFGLTALIFAGGLIKVRLHGSAWDGYHAVCEILLTGFSIIFPCPWSKDVSICMLNMLCKKFSFYPCHLNQFCL